MITDGLHSSRIPLPGRQTLENAQVSRPPIDYAKPLDRAAEVLGMMLREEKSADTRVVVVVDQLEELFTLCADRHERRAFIALLSSLAEPVQGTGPVALVVLGLRSDYFTACANHPILRRTLQNTPIVVGPMSEAELREAIHHPAHAVGLEIEPGLVDLLLRDLWVPASSGQGVDVYEAGRLPFLAYALQATWQQRHGSILTVAAYKLTGGGIQDAVANAANRVFERLKEPAQHLARSLFCA